VDGPQILTLLSPVVPDCPQETMQNTRTDPPLPPHSAGHAEDRERPQPRLGPPVRRVRVAVRQALRRGRLSRRRSGPPARPGVVSGAERPRDRNHLGRRDVMAWLPSPTRTERGAPLLTWGFKCIKIWGLTGGCSRRPPLLALITASVAKPSHVGDVAKVPLTTVNASKVSLAALASRGEGAAYDTRQADEQHQRLRRGPRGSGAGRPTRPPALALVMTRWGRSWSAC
jgi:hypothetical protein